jgi:ribonuclease Z
MDLSVAFLGTGGSVPTARRATACTVVLRGGDRIMFDCGEGAQRQMHRSLGLVQLDEIFITHLHLDHFLGLPGLLKTYDLQGREVPLTIYGPPGIRALFDDLGRLIGRTRYEVAIEELAPEQDVDHGDFGVEAFMVEHRTKAFGYRLAEQDRPGRFDAAEAQRLGVPEGPGFSALQRGEEIKVADGVVRPEDVLGEARPGRVVVFSGDTAPCISTAEAAKGAELLIHDGSFAEDEAQRAAETGHSTAGQAAALAREAGVKMLALVHVSSRYNVGQVLEEARAVLPGTIAPRDFDLVEIPFPERGEPLLVPNGARERPGPLDSEASQREPAT